MGLEVYLAALAALDAAEPISSDDAADIDKARDTLRRIYDRRLAGVGRDGRIAELERAMARIRAEISKIEAGQQCISPGLRAIAQICEMQPAR